MTDASTDGAPDGPPDDSQNPAHRSVALVLGAGGVVGHAYHCGVLAALAEGDGWDPRRADLIVGTSAGSGIGAWLRVGVSAADLLARATGEPLSSEGAALEASLPPAQRFPPAPDERPGPRALLPAAPWLAAASLLPLGRPRPMVAVAGVLPRGRRPTAMLGDRLRAAHPARWPDRATWICAARLRDGHRVVFGRDDVAEPDLGLAVEASSAVPGLMRPVVIEGTTYVDGGVHSTTNADLVARLGFDLVVVVAPMAGVPSAVRATRPYDLGRAYQARTLAQEVQAVRAGGSQVLVIQPTIEDLGARRANPLDHRQSQAVARQALRSTRRMLERDGTPDVLGG